MKKIITAAALGAATLALAACDSSDDASTDLEIESVEQPAETALEAVEEEPVADAAVSAPVQVAGPPPVSAATAEEAADAAENVAAAVEAAEAAEAADAAMAAEAAEAAANLETE